MFHYQALLVVVFAIVLTQSRYNKTFPELIEAGSYPCINGTFSNITTNQTQGLTIIFKKSRNYTSYEQVLSFQRLHMNIDNNNCFSIYLETTEKRPDSLKFNINMYCNNKLYQLTVRYLIVSSQLLKDIIFVPIIANFSNSPFQISDQDTKRQVNSTAVSSNYSQVNTAFIIQGFTIDNNNAQIDLILRQRLNSTHFSIIAKRQNARFKIYFLCVKGIIIKNTIVIYNITGTFSHYYNKSTYRRPRQFNFSGMITEESTAFFGISSFISNQVNMLNFQFKLNSYSELYLLTYDDPSNGNPCQLHTGVIDFTFQICSSYMPSYFFPINNTCLSACPYSYFTNKSEPYLCQLCSDNCLTCSKLQSNCTKCVNTSYLTANNTCTPCTPSECITCSPPNNCTSCITNYKVQNGICVPNCTIIDKCDTCVFNSSIYCTRCIQVFQLLNQVCLGQCGDGIKNMIEECDDGGKLNGDGCSSTCTIEQYYECLQPNSSCTLRYVQINFSYAVKKEHANLFTAYYSIKPNLAFMDDFDWKSGLKFIQGDIKISELSIFCLKGVLVLECEYGSDLNQKEVVLELQYRNLNSNKITSHQKNILSHKLVTQNNLALVHYSSLTYQLAMALEYIALALSCLSLFMFVLGYVAGKLIALQNLAVIQLTYLCTITVSEASPTFTALRSLRITTGSIQTGEYDYSNSLDPHLKGASFSPDSLPNFYICLAVISFPLFAAAILKILSVSLCKGKEAVSSFFSVIVGEVAFYGMMFSAYAVFSQLSFGLASLASGKSTSYAGLAISFILALVTFFYCYFLNKDGQHFGVFKRNFQKFNICEYFYTFVALEKLISSLIIIFLRNISIGVSIQLIPIVVLLVFVVIRKPYVEGGSTRALINYLGTTCIIVLFTVNNLIGSSMSVLIYLPTLILFILMFILSISSIYQFKQLKELYTQAIDSKIGLFRYCINNFLKQQKQKTLDEKNQYRFEYFRSKIMDHTPGINPLSNMRNENTQQPAYYEINVNEEWEYFTKVHRKKLTRTRITPNFDRQND